MDDSLDVYPEDILKMVVRVASNDVRRLVAESMDRPLTRDEATTLKIHGDLMITLEKRDKDAIEGAGDEELASLLGPQVRQLVGDETVLQWAEEIKSRARAAKSGASS